jgi:hypothetical protein
MVNAIPLDSLLARESLRVADLERIYHDGASAPGFWRGVARSLTVSEPSGVPWALWLILRLSRDRQPEPELLQRALDVAPSLEHWTARLLLAQLFAHATCPAAAIDALEDFLGDAVEDRRPIIRAWALSSAYRLGEDYPAYRKTAADWLARARSDPTKSVQARLRHLKPAAPPRSPRQPKRPASKAHRARQVASDSSRPT